MIVTFPYPFSGGGSGWTCPRCGSWVPNGATHSCVISSPPPQQTDMQRIAFALERIAASLERMNEREVA